MVPPGPSRCVPAPRVQRAPAQQRAIRFKRARSTPSPIGASAATPRPRSVTVCGEASDAVEEAESESSTPLRRSQANISKHGIAPCVESVEASVASARLYRVCERRSDSGGGRRYRCKLGHALLRCRLDAIHAVNASHWAPRNASSAGNIPYDCYGGRQQWQQNKTTGPFHMSGEIRDLIGL